MIWDRERYIAHSLFEDTGREMFCELFGPLHALESEWRLQGATEKEIGMTAFDWDYVPVVGLAGHTGARTGIPMQILEDTEEITRAIDGMGRHTKLIKKSATIALPLDYPVTTPDDWERVKHWYAFTEDRVSRETLLEQRKQWERGQLTMIDIPGAFDQPRQLLGEAGACLACYEEPEMLHDMEDLIASYEIYND